MPEIVTITTTVRPKWDSKTIRNIAGAVMAGVLGSLGGMAPVVAPDSPYWAMPVASAICGVFSIFFGRRAMSARMSVGDLVEKRSDLNVDDEHENGGP